MLSPPATAAPLSIAQWFNTEASITLDSLRGRVVLIHAFQMLCPGCVAQGLPQAMKVHQLFPASEVVVLGLHTVFEHHDAMTPTTLKAFLHEYRITFPVGVDRPAADSPIPTTMQAYGLRGTPSLIVIDRQGVVRLNHFGHIEDLALGALLGTLVSEAAPEQVTTTGNADRTQTPDDTLQADCDDQGCTIGR